MANSSLLSMSQLFLVAQLYDYTTFLKGKNHWNSIESSPEPMRQIWILQSVKEKYLDRTVLLGLVSTAEHCIFVLDEIQDMPTTAGGPYGLTWSDLIWFIENNSWDRVVWTAPSPPPSCEMKAKAWLGSSNLESNKFEDFWLQLATNLACFVWPSDTRILSSPIEYAHGPRTKLPGDLHATQRHMLEVADGRCQ